MIGGCVQENSGKFKGTGMWKLPTGVVNEGSFQKIRKHFLHNSISNGLSYIVNWPIKPRHHWSLLIFCHFGESKKSETRTPCMLLLDSLEKANPRQLEPDIRKYVPQQRNGFEPIT
ncbi:hypothetical protein CFP56_025662 [Quercus suber]|uniref:Ubiquitin-like protease family profile domain-containing protein n=1 Tax=Quercus suber TaxID=58331 RepID=A0AAW0K3T3_QUESU